MLNNILNLSKELIKIKSIEGNSKELEEILELALSDLNEYTVERFEKNGVKSALVYNTDKRPEKFKIILNGHLDVIPGKSEQYNPREEDGKLYGVGSMDMKANLACIILAFKEIAKKVDYPLGLQLVTDEEIGGFDGTKYQVEEQGVSADFIISSEPTNFNIVNEAKGVLWLEISTKGKTAHGAYPWRGENAILKMNNFISELQKMNMNPDKQKWVSTFNLSSIETSNVAFNKIPDNCLIKLDIRYTPEDKDVILDKIKNILPKDFKLKTIANESALITDSNDVYLKKLKKAGEDILGEDVILRGAQGSSDVRHFAKVGYAGVEFGPIGEGIGGDNEWVDIESLEKYYNIIEKFLLLIK